MITHVGVLEDLRRTLKVCGCTIVDVSHVGVQVEDCACSPVSMISVFKGDSEVNSQICVSPWSGSPNVWSGCCEETRVLCVVLVLFSEKFLLGVGYFCLAKLKVPQRRAWHLVLRSYA